MLFLCLKGQEFKSGYKNPRVDACYTLYCALVKTLSIEVCTY